MRSFTIMFIEIAEKPSIFSFLSPRKREKWEFNIFIMSFPWKRESSFLSVISLFCHSRENGNPIFSFCHSRENASILSFSCKRESSFLSVISLFCHSRENASILSFPWKRESIFLSVVPLFCYSRENASILSFPWKRESSIFISNIDSCFIRNDLFV